MKNYFKITLVLISLILCGLFANADSAYKNELTKVSLIPINSNDVKITLYMAKPYSEPLRLLRKNDGEFVLILPETYNSSPQKPSISDVIGEVTDAEVKLYSFVSNSVQNGYTKIVIKTNGLVNLYPEAVTSGGGTLVNNEVHKIVSEQVKPKTQPVTQPTAQKPAATNQKAETKPAIQNQSKVEKKVEKKTETKTDIKKSAQNNEKTEAIAKNDKSKTSDKKENKTVNNENEKVNENELPIVNLPKIEKSSGDSITDVPLEQIDVSENKTPEIKDTNKKEPFFVAIKTKIKSLVSGLLTKSKSENGKKLNENIFISLLALVVGIFFLRFANSVIKSAKPESQETIGETSSKIKSENSDTIGNTQNENGKEGYSTFFKTLIESEVKGDNPFTVGSAADENSSMDLSVEPVKSHEEILNADQNLTWQEKFRALQKNKKSLLSDDDTTETTYTTEINDDMHFENPIKKLKEDFKAVRKVLEKQKSKLNETNTDTNIPQNLSQENVENVEVISFEDLSQKVKKPKVHVDGTMPIKAKPPKILTQLQLADSKGFYLVDYQNKISLIGYIGQKVFKLNSYNSLRDTKLYARMTEKLNNQETYILKFDNNKMLVDVSDEQMKIKLMY